MLFVGLFCTSLGAGLVQFVLLGLIGVVLLPLGLVFLIAAVIISILDGQISTWKKIFCALLFCGGAFALVFEAGWASSLAYDHAISLQREQQPPSIYSWLMLGLTSLLPALALMLGLRFLQVPWRHCLGWCIATLCVVPLALLIFWVLLPTNPITA
jgi:hypothetical protein